MYRIALHTVSELGTNQSR